MAKKPEKAAEQAQPNKTGQQSLTETKPAAIITSNINLEEDAGAGQESMGKDDYAIPRLSILQALSPQVKKGESKIEGAEEGMIIDTVSNRLFDGEAGINVVPLSYRRTFIEWKLRESGGGFVKDHGSEGAALQSSCKRDERGRDILQNGNQLVATCEYFVMLVSEDGGFSPYVLSMTGAQSKKSRKWNTMINQLRVPRADGSGTFNPAMFYSSYNLQTVPESNEQGSWFGWKISMGTPTLNLPDGESIYLACRNLREMIKSGAVQASAPSEHAAGDSTESEDSPM